MNENKHVPQKPSLLIRFFRFLIRLIFILMIGMLLGAVIYWGVPTLYRQFIQPVQIHSMQLEALDTRLDLLEEGSSDKFSSFQGRIQALESQQDNDKEKIAALESQFKKAKYGLATQQAQMKNLGSLAEQLTELEEKLGEIQNAQSALDSDSQDMQTLLNTLEEQLAQQKTQIEELSQVINTKDERWAAIQSDMQTLQVMELLNRARYNLMQGKLVLAQADIKAAYDLLAALHDQASEEQAEMFQAILEFLDTALVNLPDSPVLSADNLEGAWELMRQALPVIYTPQPDQEGTPAPTLTPLPTATPTPTS